MSTTHLSPVTSPAFRAVLLAPLASLVVPGLGLALSGRVRTGVLILAGFVASVLIPVQAVAVAAMFAFWLSGLTALYDAEA